MKRHLLWIVELFIWFFILAFIAGGIMLAKYNYKKQFNTYQIFLPDVDGMITGSPVRFLGIQIGYVNQIDIVGDDVYVKFVVTDPNVKLPRGTSATVEFSGLGGSKSLELYPPKKSVTRSSMLITPQRPKRIHDSLGLLNDMFNKAIGLTYDVSDFMDQIGLIKQDGQKNVVENEKTANEIINDSNDWLDEAQKQFDKLNGKLNNKNNKSRKGYKNEQPREN